MRQLLVDQFERLGHLGQLPLFLSSISA